MKFFRAKTAKRMEQVERERAEVFADVDNIKYGKPKVPFKTKMARTSSRILEKVRDFPQSKTGHFLKGIGDASTKFAVRVNESNKKAGHDVKPVNWKAFEV